MNKQISCTFILILIISVSAPLAAQQDSVILDLPEIIDLAIQNNASLRAGALEVDRQEELVRQGYNWDKTGLFYHYDENNIAENGFPVRVWGVRQSFAFPTVYNASKQALMANVSLTRHEYTLREFELKKQVSRAFHQLGYYSELQKRFVYLDSLYRNFSTAARRRFETGESNYLERITAEAKMKEVELMMNKNRQELASARLELQTRIQSDSLIGIPDDSFRKTVPPQSAEFSIHPGVEIWNAYEEMADWQTRTARNQLLPDLQLSYFQGTNNQPESKVYQGFEVGIAVPLLYGTQKGQIRAGRIQQNIYSRQKENYLIGLESQQKILQNKLAQIQESLDYYENNGQTLSREIIRASERSFQEGEIDYFQFIQSIDNAVRIEMTYLESLLNYNLTAVELQYLTNKP
ncbi:TolC family protein [Fulvivirga sedimenti]|uniref:TolC family protein n=1 Tax=Fulvivirga sedimenti TaxID=2879465 RepID=A0A9X1HVI1_9BACT|nr:TolC family protein [Fulvivirga sedimenti]MCA6074697.1 TolC family protein [Fulvivirga sedimenti]MCA6075874.1 TolC family protein [Fulvivirga sedimenti]MCA6077002.1 TolC family protein [Fulvivirga sedimenti]